MAPNVWAHNIQICSHLSKYVNIYGTYLERLVVIPIYNDYCKINIKNLKKSKYNGGTDNPFEKKFFRIILIF